MTADVSAGEQRDDSNGDHSHGLTGEVRGMNRSANRRPFPAACIRHDPLRSVRIRVSPLSFSLQRSFPHESRAGCASSTQDQCLLEYAVLLQQTQIVSGVHCLAQSIRRAWALRDDARISALNLINSRKTQEQRVD
jgi:hypothetical protein